MGYPIFNHDNYIDFDEWKYEFAESMKANGIYPETMTPDEIIENATDEEKWQFMSDQEDIDYDNEKDNIQSAIGSRRIIAQGAAQVWNGTFAGGFIADNLQGAIDEIAGRDSGYIGFFVDDDGELEMTFTHHDGTHCVILRAITSAGEEYISDNEYNYDTTDEAIEKEVFSNPAYSEMITGV